MNQATIFIRLKILHCLWVFILVVSVTFSVLFIQTALSYISDTHSRLHFAIGILDKQFSNVTITVQSLLEQVTADCAKDDTTLSNALVREPIIQSLVIEKNREIICSTHQPNVGLKNGSERFINFNVITSVIVVPGETIAVIKYGNENLAVAATIHGFNLFGALDSLNKGAPIHLNYKDAWVNGDKKLVHTINPDTIYLHSNLFPYSISTTYDYTSIFHHFFTTNSSSLVLSLFFSIFCTVIYSVYGSERVMIQAIKKGIVRREFEPYAQGVTDKDGQLTGCEILMRWNHRKNTIRPDIFIPVAEKSELIVPMSIRLIEDTYTFFSECETFFGDGFHIAFNISPVQLTCKYSTQLIQAVSRFRQSEKLNSARIILEITERQIVVHTSETLNTIHQLHDMGVHIVIDDFGTGYSSLENLLELEIDGLKIDKRFVDRFPQDLLSVSLIDNMIDLAQKLDVPIVAEGVETQVQATALTAKGVDYLQGYLFYRPLPLVDFMELRHSNSIASI